MATLKTLKGYLNYEFSSGSYTGKDYKTFETKYINYLKTLCTENCWQFVKANRNHYEFSAFIRNNENKYVYLSISDVRFFQNEWYNRILIRTANDERDYHGGHNNYSSLEYLTQNINKLFYR